MGRVSEFYATGMARTNGINSVVMTANNRSWAYHVEDAARQHAVSAGLPGFWRLKERKA